MLSITLLGALLLGQCPNGQCSAPAAANHFYSSQFTVQQTYTSVPLTAYVVVSPRYYRFARVVTSRPYYAQVYTGTTYTTQVQGCTNGSCRPRRR